MQGTHYTTFSPVKAAVRWNYNNSEEQKLPLPISKLPVCHHLNLSLLN